jgi:hypothetical protein
MVIYRIPTVGREDNCEWNKSGRQASMDLAEGQLSCWRPKYCCSASDSQGGWCTPHLCQNIPRHNVVSYFKVLQLWRNLMPLPEKEVAINFPPPPLSWATQRTFRQDFYIEWFLQPLCNFISIKNLKDCIRNRPEPQLCQSFLIHAQPSQSNVWQCVWSVHAPLPSARPSSSTKIMTKCPGTREKAENWCHLPFGGVASDFAHCKHIKSVHWQ